MSKPFPGLDVPLLAKDANGNLTGLMNQTWYDYFQQHQKLAQLPDVSTTAPTNNQVLTFKTATGLWTPV
jgi:hypothetical protein